MPEHDVREEFLARMSHEFRTPLNAVIGFSRLLESNRAGNQRPEDIHLLGRIRAGGEHLLRLVEDVLEQARVAHGNLTVEMSDIDVAAVSRRVIGNHRERASAKGLLLASVLPTEPALLSLDGGRLEQVLDHLLDNAIKFTTRGAIRVELRTSDTGRPLCMDVSDTGIGIPADRLDSVFEPFEQVDPSTRREHDGAGLGLPIARRLCGAMGCALTVNSVPGKGSRFTITFPD